ncbi:hypothetical protein [Naasia sp. SYSU D00948]|uniref:hypothetical protein n=1 Tax=Naasia sp. SYSU D00948 TaxID=2817379 RepID=UPI001B30D86A|nr:hypothetical protein [Naasia sp. SYSU D00948]
MELVRLGDWEMTYRSLELLDYGAGGQIYGTLTGTVTGERLSAQFELTNLAPRRSDNVNIPTLRGVLRMDDGAVAYAELDGVSVLRPEDGARAHFALARFRTGDERYIWLNTLTGLLEAVLDRVALGGHVHAVLYECRHTLA